MKRKTMIAAIGMLLLALTVFGSIAYFTTEDVAHNVITTGEIDIELHEWADEQKTIPFPEGGVDGVMPGTGITKIVELTNNGANAAFVRIKVDKAITLSGQSGETPDLDLVELDFNTGAWTKQADGFYYYNTVLEPGETTDELFTRVSLGSGMGNLYQNSSIEVTVKAYAVQSANNGTDPLTALGWPAE